MHGRRGASVPAKRSAEAWDQIYAAAFCEAGVTFSRSSGAIRVTGVGQAWHFQYLRRGPRNRVFCVAHEGLRRNLCSRSGAFSACIEVRGSLGWNWNKLTLGHELTSLDFAWQAKRFQRLWRSLWDRRGVFSTCIEARRNLATNWNKLTPLHFCVAGEALSAAQAHFVW